MHRNCQLYSIDMKKVLFLIALSAIMASSAMAQLTHKGIRFGLGPSYVNDDQLTSLPVIGANLGVYANYGFENAQSFWADNLYLQFGFNLTRRGTHFEQVLENIRSYRQGTFRNYYAEIPVMACWRYELPTLEPDHYLNFYVGPVLSVGLFGRYHDRCITPGYPQSAMNYDTYLSSNKDDRRSFKNIRRLDCSVQLGVGYKHGNITIDLIWEHGFVPLMREDDVLRQLVISQNGGNTNYTNPDGSSSNLSNRNAYCGTNQAFLLCVGYQLPWD